MIDLEKPADVYAVQINYHDYQSNMYGRYEGLHHRYLIEGSLDGENWDILVDRKESYRDTRMIMLNWHYPSLPVISVIKI